MGYYQNQKTEVRITDDKAYPNEAVSAAEKVGHFAPRRTAALIAVTVACALVPVFGLIALVVFAAAYAACFYAFPSPISYLVFIPGAAIATGITGALGYSPTLCLGAILFAYAVSLTLCVTIHDRASASICTLYPTVAIVVLGTICLLGYAISQYGTPHAAINAAYRGVVSGISEFFELLRNELSKYVNLTGSQLASVLGELSLSDSSTEALARSVMLSLPGYAVATAFVVGWICQLVSRPFLKLAGRNDLLPKEKRLRIPGVMIAVYLIVRVISLTGEETLLGIMSINGVIGLRPLFYIVGGGTLVRLFSRLRPPFSLVFGAIFILWMLSSPALLPSVLVASAIYATIILNRTERETGGGDE